MRAELIAKICLKATISSRIDHGEIYEANKNEILTQLKEIQNIKTKRTISVQHPMIVE